MRATSSRRRNGFGHVIRSTQFQSEDDVNFGIDRADHDDGDRGHHAHPAAHLHAVHAGKQHVQQHDVRRAGGEEGEPLGAVGGHVHLEAFAPEPDREGVTIRLLVLDHQDSDALIGSDHARMTSGRDPREAR